MGSSTRTEKAVTAEGSLAAWRELARRKPWAVAATLAVAAWLVTWPWGNYGLNDDWVYAHVAKDFAETGSFHLIPTAASALGPAVLAWPLIKLFGFSHTLLRVLSMVFSVLCIWALDRLLAHVTRSASLRFAALALVVFNPIYFYASTTYMTEIHGWVPSLLAGVLWFWDRERVEAKADPAAAVVSLPVGLVVAAVIGLTFWTRQWCVVVYPALVGATLARVLLERRTQALRRSVPVLLLGTVLWAAAIYAFFPWAKATGNLRPEFTGQFPNLISFNGPVFVMQSGGALVYLTVFFLPFLALVPWGTRHRWMQLGISSALLALALYARSRYEATAGSDYEFTAWIHKSFPYVVNIIYNAGVGPVTIDDAFAHAGPRPFWPKPVWAALEVIFVAATVRWSPLCVDFTRVLRERARGLRFEVTVFGALLAAGCLVAALQVYKNEINDRYYLPILLGLIFVVTAVLSSPTRRSGRMPVMASRAVFAALLLPMAWFSVAGIHDQFRWQDARWQLIEAGLKRGATHATLQSGWEVNCWYKYEELTREPVTCDGGCRCTMGYGFCCVDDRWRVGMAVLPGYQAVESIQPNYWLAQGPPLILSRR